jgi:integrase
MAELPQIRFHDLRHTHATLALQTGVHPKVISEQLGHSSVAMTVVVAGGRSPARVTR